MREIFDLLARIQQRCSIDLVLIGGWALQAHGYARQTVDVDCMAAVESHDQIGDELGKAGFECFDEMPAFRRFRHRLDPFMILDVMRVNASTFEKIWAKSQPFDFNGVALRVPALAHLIALKLHAARNEHRGSKDIDDVAQLLSLNPGEVPPVELRELIDQFGIPEHIHLLRHFL